MFADNRRGCIVGDVVLIQSCPAISKRKHYTIEEVVAYVPRYTPTDISQDTPQEGQATSSAEVGAAQSQNNATISQEEVEENRNQMETALV